MNKHSSVTISNALTALLLCEGCERLFNENGERSALRWIKPKGIPDGEFPLFDRLRVAVEYHSFPGATVYAGSQIGVDTEKFGYFALSILWRASVQRWRLRHDFVTEQVSLGHFEEPIRKFLLGEAPFPLGVAIVLTVCNDAGSRASFYPPTLQKGTPLRVYGMLTQGVHFDIVLDTDLAPELRQICCVGSEGKFLFLRDRSDEFFKSFSYLAFTSKPTPNLEHQLVMDPSG